MLEAAETGRVVSRSEMKPLRTRLRERLLRTQARLRKAPFSVVVVFGGVDGAGKGETANVLSEWMDPRYLRTHAYGDPRSEERELPEHWRFWRDLPPHGTLSVVLGGWHHQPFLSRVYGEISGVEFERRLDRINSLEQTLAADGTLILKFWMHLGKAQQEERFKRLEADPLQSWRVTPLDWSHWQRYDDFVLVAEEFLERTSTDAAAWTIVEGLDANYRNLTVGTTLLEAIEQRLDGERPISPRDDPDASMPLGAPVPPVIAP